jgi:hypothetical protein
MHAIKFTRSIANHVLAASCCAFLLLTSSCSPTKMEMAEFSKLKPFKGRVAKVENIGFPERVTSMTAPDYRVTVVRADGSSIVINKVHTTWMTNKRLERLVDTKKCNLPNEIVECADAGGTG